MITELIIGYMQPGRPLAMMLFKSWGYMMAYNGLNYVSDMKIGHYMKVSAAVYLLPAGRCLREWT